jgi:hypothetical protein
MNRIYICRREHIMEKITADFDLLCDGHVITFELLRKLHFFKLTEMALLTDPLTDEPVGNRMRVETRKWHKQIIYWLLIHTVDPDGQDKINRMIDRNLIRGLAKRDSSQLRGWKVLACLLCIRDYITGKCAEVDD